MSGDWRRLHRFHGVSSGSPENHWVPWLILKAKTEEPKAEVQQHRTGLTGGSDRSDRWVLVRPVGTGQIGEEHRSDRCAMTQSGDFEAEDTHRDHKACLEAKQV
jgi:hypothetical protein